MMIDVESPTFTYSIAIAGIILFASGEFGRDKADRYILMCMGATIFLTSVFAIALGKEAIRNWINLGLGGLLSAFILMGGIPGIRLDRKREWKAIRVTVVTCGMGLLLLILYSWVRRT